MWPTFASASKSLALSSFAPFRLLAPLLSTISCVFSYCFFCRGGREVAASSLGRGSGAATGNVYGGQWKTVIYTRARAHKHRSKLGLRVHSTFRGHEPAEQTETKLNYNQTHIAHRFVCGACNKSEQVNGALRLRV